MALKGTTNAEKIWNFLMAEFQNPYGVAGLMGNLYAESGLNPVNLENTYNKKLNMSDEEYTKAVDEGKYANFAKDSAGYGLAQWTYSSRKLNLLTHIKNKGVSIGDLEGQLEFLIKELKAYIGIYSVLNNAKTVEEASTVILTKYERPANQSDAVKVKRASYGQKYFEAYYKGEKEENIMSNYNKYINSTGTHYISNSGSDERKKYNSGSAGDQTGHEWELRSWYSRPWTHIFRYEKDPRVGQTLAELGCAAALNNNIGYDQYQRTTYWKQLQTVGYDPSKITVKCEEDCSAGTAANVKAAGYILGIKALQNVSSSMTSRNTVSQLKAAGFTVLTESKYCSSGNYLLPGDILLYENHHVAINVTKGKKAVAVNVSTTITSTPTISLPIIGTALAKATMFVRPSETSTKNYGTVSKGAKVQVVELLNSGWMKIIWNNSPTGYGFTSNRNNKYYTYTKLEVTATSANVYITTGKVNVRSNAGKTNKILVSLPSNFKVNATGNEKEVDKVKWLEVKFTYKNKEYTGYISTKYLKKV